MRKKAVKLTAGDSAIYDALSNPNIFADLFNGSMFGGEQVLNADMLCPHNEKKQQQIQNGTKKPTILMRTRDNQRLAAFPPNLLPWKDYFADYRLNLVSCSTVDHRNFKTGLSEVFELLNFTNSDRRMLKFLDQRKEHYEHLDVSTYDLISRFLDIPTLDMNSIGDIAPERGVNMCTAIKQMVSKGKAEGIVEGISIADDRYSQLLKILLKENRFQDIHQIAEDYAFKQKLYQQFGII